MSLLLDALKRAEQEKLTRQTDRPAAATERPAAPLASAAPAANSASLELQPLASAPLPRTDAAAGAQAAQTVFKAKMPAPPPRNRSALLAAVAAIVVVLIAAGAFVWYSIRSLPLPRPAAMARVRPAPIAPAPDLAALHPEPMPAAPPVGPIVPAAPVAAADPLLGGPKPAPAAPSPAAATPPSPADELLKQPTLSAQGPVKLARTEQKPRVPPQVEEGYEALLAGDLTTARARYAAGLEADPANVDALLGLATVAARSGDLPAAAGAYRRALALDPQNATALAGLASLASDARPEALESQLRADLALHPESAALQLTLGNLYASQGRWADAQAAYFEAHRLQPENADIAYNLAVSLDHLGQRRPAADFYRRALESRRGASSQFDAAAAARRLEELGR
jgi:tetratricopeptide (TPR) repeat protein